MGAMPAGGEWHCGLVGRDRRARRRGRSAPGNRHDINLTLPKSQRRFDSFDQARTVFLRDRDAILNNLHTRAESLEFLIGIDAYNLVVDPYAEVTLLLKKFEELPRLGFGWNGNPEGDENSYQCAFFVIPSGAQRSRGISG